jgi:hypothetical protein
MEIHNQQRENNNKDGRRNGATKNLSKSQAKVDSVETVVPS